MTRKVSFTYEEKQKGKYTAIYFNDDEKQVYEDLSQELIAKKINQCAYIKSIKRVVLYDGFQKIIVTYDHGRRVYIVKDH